MRPPIVRCRLGLVCIAVLFPAVPAVFAQVAPPPRLFDFHSGFWMNLHHFLYRQAQLAEPQSGSHSLALTKADNDEMERLSAGERVDWNTAVFYYRTSLVKRDLLFDDELIATKAELEEAEPSVDLGEAKIPAELKTALLRAAPIYRKHWWPRHDTENRAWIAQLTQLVDRYGATISTTLVRVYDRRWPEFPVRVDAVRYANWAGAYTTIYPTRPTIATADPANDGAAALEIVFHETSHGMMDKVMEAMRTAEANVTAHRAGDAFHAGSIWHAVLFYTAGEIVKESIPGYRPYADKNGLWVRAWPDPDRALIEQDWRPHLNGSLGLEQAVTKLVSDLAAAPSQGGRSPAVK